MGTVLSPEMAEAAKKLGADVMLADVLDVPLERQFGIVTLFHVIEHVRNLRLALDHLDKLLLPGGYLILEYPNGRSLLKRVFQRRWFGYDPPYHRLQINPRILADNMGLRNYRLIGESHFSLEYSFFIFAQTMANALLPFQRDALYRLLQRRDLTMIERWSAYVTVLILVVSAPLFLIYQPIASLLRMGCIVRQIFKKTDAPIP
jgi:2-polyprenyl-3-methyl-5-hydroxy-6-metoxy-1,4-benzoquinol methylase